MDEPRGGMPLASKTEPGKAQNPKKAQSRSASDGLTIAVFLQDFAGGGAERVAVTLANGLHRNGHNVVFVVVRNDGPFRDRIDPEISVVELKTDRTAAAPFELSRIIGSLRPDIILSHMTHVNVAAILAGLLSGYAQRTVVVEHNQFDKNYAIQKSRAVKLAYKAVKYLYPSAGALVSVSEGVEKTLRTAAGVDHNESYVIYNPVVHENLVSASHEQPDHSWLQGSRQVPTIVSVGSLTEQKDYPNLLHALRILNDKVPVRAIILGEGEERPNLEALIRDLNLTDVVDMPGFVKNPYAYMRSADVFALPSRWEGLPTVVIEALACGARIVSTDCPSGPREILMNGKFGKLVPVDNAMELAHGIVSALKNPVPEHQLMARANMYGMRNALESYEAVFEQLTEDRSARKGHTIRSVMRKLFGGRL